MNRRTFVAAAGSATTVALAGCLGSGAPAGDHDVGMTVNSFRPDELTVDAGTTVEFRNTSSHTHTVTAFEDGYPDGAEYWSTGDFEGESEAVDAWKQRRGGKLPPGESYEHTFEMVGTYSYYCIPHIEADMTGVVVVES